MGAATKWVLFVIVVVAATVAGYFLSVPRPPELVVADPDCRSDAPVMAIDLNGDLRQDDVAVIHRDGAVERLTRDHASFDATFSPDGSQIAFTSGREGVFDECCGFTDYEIYVMNSDGTGQRRLMKESNDHDWSPAWSPDGSQIAFVRNGTRLMLVSPTGEDPREIYRSRVEMKDLDWSPDGDRIALFINRRLHVIDAAGGTPEPVAEGLDFSEDVAWSPDGTSLAVTGDVADVYLIELDGSEPQPFALDAHTPAWSPDGKFVAYYIEPNDDFRPQIVAQPVEGGDPVEIEADRKNLYSFATNLEWLDCV